MVSSFLIIQTAFLGDVILATSVVEKLHAGFPEAKIDFLLRKGNEGLLLDHPFIREVIILDKKKNKIKNLFNIALKVRRKKYDRIINLHRFGSSGFITWLSGSKEKIGFDKNPFSFCFTKKVKHEIGNGKHETERNLELIKDFTDEKMVNPKLYPSEKDFASVKKLTVNYPQSNDNYICIAPASVWFTKQFPKEKWIELVNSFKKNISVFLLGATSDLTLCEEIKSGLKNQNITVKNLAGKLSLLETAALMQKAQMNYVNDSAPLHIASAMNAPVTAIFCSTIPDFGFGPLSASSRIIETKETLDCRPCGLHGFRECPKGHFKCALTIEINDILKDGAGN